MAKEIRVDEELHYRGVLAINACVERIDDPEDRAAVLRSLRDHLDARIEQTEPLETDNSDLL